MSGDWFEEAINELDDVDPDAESTETSLDDVDRDAESADLSHDDEETDESDAADDSPPSLDSPDESESTTSDASDTDAASSNDAEPSDPFGFAGEDADVGSPAEFDADSSRADEFGFSAEDDGEAADSAPMRPESSMAQSPEEFGFSLDETADEAGSAPPPDSPAPASSTEPAVDSAEPAADQSDDDPFGFGNSGGGGGSLPAMEGGGDDEFGFGGFGGGGGSPTPSGPETFDDEEFESEIDRIDLGIEGLDDMILGGVPERSLIGIIGGAGTGKTTFGLQFLNQALTQGQRAVFITLEQTEEAVLSTAEEKGWPFRQYVEDEMLAVVVLDPVEMANSLASIRGDISRLIREFGASRLVLDSVSLLEMMYDHPAKRRSEIFDFTRSLKKAGVTTLLTSEASEDSSHASRYGAVEYLTDAVFVLRYVRTSNFEETRLAIEIQKIRDANHSRATKPYDLTDEGMSVHKQANIF